jgi:hypothetical protein
VIDIDEPGDRAQREEQRGDEDDEIERFRRFIDEVSPEGFGRS